jgi:hypothetical protein
LIAATALPLAGHQRADQRQALRPRQLAHDQRHGDILRRRQVRIKRVGLEDHGNVAVCRRHRRQVALAKHDFAGVSALEAGKDAQERALAAAGRADEGDELARTGVKADALEDRIAGKGFFDAAKRKGGHSTLSVWLALVG